LTIKSQYFAETPFVRKNIKIPQIFTLLSNLFPLMLIKQVYEIPIIFLDNEQRKHVMLAKHLLVNALYLASTK
jgi:hypothetical protein